MLVLIAAQFENIDSWLAENQWKETGGSPRQSHLLLQLSQCTPVKVAVRVVQIVPVINAILNKQIWKKYTLTRPQMDTETRLTGHIQGNGLYWE